MAKLKTVWIQESGAEENELDFKYEINVTKEGLFTALLPERITRLFKQAGIELGRNRRHTEGYYIDKTREGLENQIDEVVKEYFSRKLKSEIVVIRYIIQTTCSYCINKKKEIVPNSTSDWMGSDDYGWKEGTIDLHYHRFPYGVLIYVEPFMKRTYIYKSGKEKIEFIRVGSLENAAKFLADKYHLRWLSDLVNMQEPERGDEVKEIDYDEDVAAFFVNLIKSICMINEKIKGFIEPESIKKIAKSFNLLKS
jgi:hypothetical protein